MPESPRANEGDRQGPISSTGIGTAVFRPHTESKGFFSFCFGGFVGSWFFSFESRKLTSASGKINKLFYLSVNVD